MKSASPRHHSCQVRSTSPSGRHVWTFQLSKNALTPAGETILPASAQAQKITASQDWKSLVQPQLNIAWLPADSVFIRAIQLPSGEPAELPAMVEFQLEKISPLPLNQIVWTALGVPHPDGAQQTAVVTVANRTAVEEFLNAEVASGFTPDRLDLPLLRWWSQLRPEDSGIWILLEE
ncbi:MAG: Type pilus assembly protein PilM, partial [Verrucomicrobiota bacterium]